VWEFCKAKLEPNGRKTNAKKIGEK